MIIGKRYRARYQRGAAAVLLQTVQGRAMQQQPVVAGGAIDHPMRAKKAARDIDGGGSRRQGNSGRDHGGERRGRKARGGGGEDGRKPADANNAQSQVAGRLAEAEPELPSAQQ